MGALKGAIGVALLTAGLIGGSVLALGPCLLILPFSRRSYEAVVSFIRSAWGYFICGITEKFYGVSWVFTGDVLPSGGRTLLMSNHRTRLDWLFLWTVSLKQNVSSGIRVILKAGLKHVPFFGWALQQLDFIFIQRRLDVDHSHMTAMMSKYGNSLSAYTLLLFPEGTDLSQHNLKRSHDFAEKNGLDRYEYVLHPRVKGFWICLQSLGASLDAVYDVTVGYTGHIPTSESSMIKGRMPRECHFHIRRYPISAVPTEDEEAASKWLQSRFAEKESRLKEFYQQGSFVKHAKDRRPFSLNPVKVYASILYFLGLFGLLVWLGCYHRLLFALILGAYFAFFFAIKRATDGIDKWLLANAAHHSSSSE